MKTRTTYGASELFQASLQTQTEIDQQIKAAMTLDYSLTEHIQVDSKIKCRSAQALAHFVGKVYYRRAAAIQHTVETPP